MRICTPGRRTRLQGLQELEPQRLIKPHIVNGQIETALRLAKEISQPPHHLGARLLAFGQEEAGKLVVG